MGASPNSYQYHFSGVCPVIPPIPPLVKGGQGGFYTLVRNRLFS